MAHRIKVKTVPYRKVDGTFSETKFEYHVACVCRGKQCASEVLSSRAAVTGWAVKHREQMKERHAGTKGRPTPRQKKPTHPMTRAARVVSQIEIDRQNRMLANLREM